MIANALIILGLFLLISKFLVRFYKGVLPQKQKETNNFSILIPARNESNVIEDLLISIKNQSEKINFENVYIIIENKSDKTIKIAKKYNANIIIREKLNLKRKGYALMEAIEKITEEKIYDAYFIFDADNILDKDYLKEMKKTYLEGYSIGIGKRKIKNKTNSIAISSQLIFTLINDLSNKNRNKYNVNANASGTGFYISGKIINKLKTYPFHSLTEDYEISLYAVINNLTTKYNEKAIYYDEQPTDYKTYFNQRTRWVKGYFETRKIYTKDLIKKLKLDNKNYKSVYTSLIGVYDLILILIGLLIKCYKYPLEIILAVYTALIIFTILLLYKENININKTLYLKVLLINPLLLLTYIPCLIKSIFKKDIEWTVIQHKEKLD